MRLHWLKSRNVNMNTPMKTHTCYFWNSNTGNVYFTSVCKESAAEMAKKAQRAYLEYNLTVSLAKRVRFERTLSWWVS